jgi:hypothetical protein
VPLKERIVAKLEAMITESADFDQASFQNDGEVQQGTEARIKALRDAIDVVKENIADIESDLHIDTARDANAVALLAEIVGAWDANENDTPNALRKAVEPLVAKASNLVHARKEQPRSDVMMRNFERSYGPAPTGNDPLHDAFIAAIHNLNLVVEGNRLASTKTVARQVDLAREAMKARSIVVHPTLQDDVCTLAEHLAFLAGDSADGSFDSTAEACRKIAERLRDPSVREIAGTPTEIGESEHHPDPGIALGVCQSCGNCYEACTCKKS